MQPYIIIDHGQYMSIMACRLMAPSHFLNLCWLITNLALRNTSQGNCNLTSCIFIHEIALEKSGSNIGCYKYMKLTQEKLNAFYPLPSIPKCSVSHITPRRLQMSSLNQHMENFLQTGIKFLQAPPSAVCIESQGNMSNIVLISIRRVDLDSAQNNYK